MRQPLAKFALLCAYVAVVLAAPGLATKGGLWALLLLIGGKKLFSRRLFRVALSFGFFIFLVQALFTPGETLVRLGPITVTGAGLRMGAAMALRFLDVLGASFLFVATTPPEEFAAALSQTRLPYRYTYILVLALRFLPLFREEYGRVREAQIVRGLALRPWNLISHVRWTMTPVLAGALARADGVALAMEGRGFGRFPRRTSLLVIPWRSLDFLALALTGLAGALAGWFLTGGGRGWP